MNRSSLAAAGVVLALVAAPALAQMYRWVDEQGRVRYTETPPPASAKGARQLPRGESAAPAKPAAAASGDGAAPKPKGQKPLEVTLYTNSGCGQLCTDARAYLASRQVKFREVEVETQESLAELQKVAGVMSVPVLRVGEAVQRGYDETRYAHMLDAAGYPKAAPAAPAPQAPL
ncbi:MAG TPA: glutaredoxin family protein, partial [Burkholderiales bacterium]|nr:glutaredoxin family protein [Burkholderiales bacterium]